MKKGKEALQQKVQKIAESMQQGGLQAAELPKSNKDHIKEAEVEILDAEDKNQ